jgi:uncharacterized protein (DUF2147 family)
MTNRFTALAALSLFMAAAPAFADNAAPHQPQGLWINPHGNVIVRTGACGHKLCGWIAWANQEAQSDARDGGVTQLLSTKLLEDYGATGTTSWKGVVFVPDMGRRFSSRIDELSPARLRIKGCILGGLICKSQIWNRIERLPDA